jgi:hypothetical protein
MCQNITETQMDNERKRIVFYPLLSIWILLYLIFMWNQIRRDRFYSKMIKEMELAENKRNEDHLYELDLLEKNQKNKESFV